MLARKGPWEAVPHETPLLCSSQFCSVDASPARRCFQRRQDTPNFSLPTLTTLASKLFGLKQLPTTGLKIATNRHIPFNRYRPHQSRTENWALPAEKLKKASRAGDNFATWKRLDQKRSLFFEPTRSCLILATERRKRALHNVLDW